MTDADQTNAFPGWVNKLPGILRERAFLCAQERNVAPDLPAILGLTAVAASIGKGLVVESGPHRQTRGNIFVLIGVPSGVGKSEVFRDILKPILEFESDLHTWWAAEVLPRARAGTELFKATVAGIRQDIRAGRNHLLPSFRMMQDVERKREACCRYLDAPCLLDDDFTPEALAVAMDRSSECLLVASADARRILRRLSMTDSKEEAFFLKGYSGDLSVTTRITRRGVRLVSPCLTSLLLVQPDAYQRFLEKTSRTRSGLLPRFLHCSLAYSPHLESSQAPLKKTGDIRINFNHLLKDLIEAFRFEKEATTIRAEPAARHFLEGLEQRSKTAAVTAETLQTEIRRRHAEHVWKMALILHAARHGKVAGNARVGLEDAMTASEIVSGYQPL